MFGSVKIKKHRLAVFAFLCPVIITVLCLFISRSNASDSVNIGAERYSLRLEDEEDITSFCEACGYPAAEQLSDREISIPKHWNETYLHYNELQKEQGFDLAPYKGKSARELVYAVTDDAYVTLLICNDTIIAAHLSASDGGEYEAVITREPSDGGNPTKRDESFD